MNRITSKEREYLSAMRQFLKPGVNEQHVLNLIRIIKNEGVQQGKSGFNQDINWNDRDLL